MLPNLKKTVLGNGILISTVYCCFPWDVSSCIDFETRVIGLPEDWFPVIEITHTKEKALQVHDEMVKKYRKEN